MNEQRYDPITQALHWLTTGCIVAAFGTSLIMEEMAKGIARTQMQGTHMSFGLLVAGLVIVRIAWRGLACRPSPVTCNSALRWLAAATHFGLYLTLVAIPLLGMLMVWAKGRSVDLFGYALFPPLIAPDRNLAHLLEDLHEGSANTMMALAGFHAAAALVHQFVLKDNVMARMFPRFRSTDA